ncbi:MAG: hypothetical protein C5B52_19200 [Bacteroidetes bacterium]|nr:MAG: hypothetical protein C5B52_19200 [Bacteroidota bacterium]
MQKALLILILIVGFGIIGFGQESDSTKSYRHEIQIVSDNDNYLLNLEDGYYTNGLFISYSFINYDRNKAKIINGKKTKAITRFELGQLIYNPHDYDSYANGNVDRPFAGYLYVKAQQSRFYENENLLRYGISVGVIGQSSFARQIQTVYHHFLGIHHLEGWQTQVNNTATVNLNFDYVYHLLGKSPRRFFDIAAIGKINAGNAFDNAIGSLVLRLGKFEKNDRSAYWNSRLDKSSGKYAKKSELFIFIQPELEYQFYNATLEGGMFLKEKGPVTSPPMPWVYTNHIGFCYAKNKIGLSFAYVHESREAKTMIANDDYATLSFSLRFN